MIFPDLHPNSWHPQTLSRPSSLGQQHSPVWHHLVCHRNTKPHSAPPLAHSKIKDQVTASTTRCVIALPLACSPDSNRKCLSSPLGQGKTSGSLYEQAAAMAKAAPIPLGLGYNETRQLGETCPSQTVLCLLMLMSPNFRHQSDSFPGPFLCDQCRYIRRKVSLLPCFYSCFAVAWTCLCAGSPDAMPNKKGGNFLRPVFKCIVNRRKL